MVGCPTLLKFITDPAPIRLDNMTDRILVTGVSGFIASHVTERLLKKGYAVRGTVRNKDKGQKIVDKLEAHGSDTSKLELFEADLGSDAGWQEAVKDCRYIQHIASPFPLEAPSDREALVPEARAGAMRVIEHGLGVGTCLLYTSPSPRD